MGRAEGARDARDICPGDGTRTSTPKTLLSGVPPTLPSLLRAYEYGSRAAAVGFDWIRPGDVIDKSRRGSARTCGEAITSNRATRITWPNPPNPPTR